ncbi:MAG TPA: DNA polymerase III subunit gamma/tau [Sneathiellales bacterium]|nr:DNA polymerase III subunit gamma/tau [Sneathiellales bacterium]
MTEKLHQDYRVLARKYRPSTFGELVGQEALVRTLTNAIEGGRLAHAFILTGTRGIGKTTTARLIARALNCMGADGPTISPCGTCDNCVSIAQSRHVDVLEMDAASRTGVDDVREIIDGVRYAPVAARYKVYIIDEVHMLSRNAFNALLKTLEEPPDHVIFVFATTEIRKVPVTVLSRCQRFDLRRVEGDVLSNHLSEIALKEGAEVEPGAIALIVRASEGSVRDGLSLLDQAIAHSGGKASETDVRDMLGLADRSRVIDLFDALMKGEIQAALDLLRDQYDQGADPVVVLQDLLELSHNVTRLKVVPDGGGDLALSDVEQQRLSAMAQKLSMPVLGRTWQMLLKGITESRMAPSPVAAAEMILVRIAYSSDLPNPADLVREISARPPNPAVPQGTSPALPTPPPAGPSAQMTETKPVPPTDPLATLPDANLPEDLMPGDLMAVAEMFAARKEGLLYAAIMNNVRQVSFQAGRIEVSVEGRIPKDFAPNVTRHLREWTGRPWEIHLVPGGTEPTLAERAATSEQLAREQAGRDPLVQKALEIFPGAKITDVRDLTAGAPDPEPLVEEEPDDKMIPMSRKAGE